MESLLYDGLLCVCVRECCVSNSNNKIKLIGIILYMKYASCLVYDTFASSANFRCFAVEQQQEHKRAKEQKSYLGAIEYFLFCCVGLYMMSSETDTNH